MMTRHAKKHLAAQAEAFGTPPPDLTETAIVATVASAGTPPVSDPRNLPVTVKTMSVPECGRLYFGLSRNASYEAAKRGDIPVVKVGRLLRAVPSVLDRRLSEAGRSPAAE
jgi:hypothetical protein